MIHKTMFIFLKSVKLPKDRDFGWFAPSVAPVPNKVGDIIGNLSIHWVNKWMNNVLEKVNNNLVGVFGGVGATHTSPLS